PSAVPERDVHALPFDRRADVERGARAREPALPRARRRGQLCERGLPRPGASALEGVAVTALRWSALLTLVGLALMVWPMLQPARLPVMLAMTVGQIVGTTAFALYLYIIIRELRRERRR